LKKILRLNLDLPDDLPEDDDLKNDICQSALKKSILNLKKDCINLINKNYISFLEKVDHDGIIVEILKDEDFVFDFFRKNKIVSIIDLYFETKDKKQKSAKEEVLEEILKRSAK